VLPEAHELVSGSTTGDETALVNFSNPGWCGRALIVVKGAGAALDVEVSRNSAGDVLVRITR